MNRKVCETDSLQAVILADEFTTSLSPLQNIYPIIMTPVINISLFDYMIDTLVKSRVQEVFLYCSNHVDLLKKYVSEINCKSFTVSLIISDGCRSLGDALRDIDAKGCIRGYFILIRGNTFTNTDLKTLLNTHRLKVEKDKGTTMTMVLRNVGSTRKSCLYDETCLLVSDKTSKKILHYAKLNNNEKKVKLELNWFLDHSEVELSTCHLDTHIYMCSSSVLPLFADNFDFQTMDDFIRGVLMNEEILDSRIYWIQLNTEDYALPITSWKTYCLLTQDILRRLTYPLTPDALPLSRNFTYMPQSIYKHKTAIIGRGCTLEKDCTLGYKSSLGNNTTVVKSVIGDNCTVGSNVRIYNSFIFSGVKVKDNCFIKNSVLFPDCSVRYASRVHGCILYPGIEVPPRSQYVDSLIESVSSDVTKTKVTKLDIHEQILYSANNEIDECDKYSTDSSSIDRESGLPSSPIPDDTSMFLSEVIDSLLRGYQDKLKCENLILEINSSRYAYNVTMREVTYNVIKAILSLPLHYLSETNTPVDKPKYQKNLKSMIIYFNPIILNYIKNNDAQEDCLRAIEDVASTTDELLPYTQHLLHLFYERDILSEEKILQWYEFISEENDVQHNKVRDVVQPFIKWLEEAEEDSSESDDE
ncbi:translation initiation factor eIF-2B subunit epsilon isoform X1 [Pseudomyrmex gracilis]|uniref:translation initiation factor eIF-2B subunit epsilon isoform X1 n=1 Tax=Pseudomyrmex gracilis TaxID=219809 RepID=UPI000995C2CC|nr:translation initiation factor eIF-2B subunit epsilon isoform X1 [Pseudomyrmex gracilis]